ncbi:sulfonate ABC transporter substrate-binding protein [Amycolatopsis sp. WAC 01376]|uniref:ABC transporter substrate-binding protein n=1 Tax=Amycolatopsis sp. WAC 01376 TaxID=2203195 RepID=UPI000F78B028|nr:ABC transporter substrate-binding protein [Amycolatopsis sp. WAC 01376]RSM67097.1 sulfonate ABC transporter substrate-binding protein [Amycolatopsis sp. WAC 01376]
MTKMRVLAIPLVAALLAIAGCGVFSGGDASTDAPLERTELRVGVGSPIDTAPLRVAVAEGKFTAAGLSVTLVDVPGDQAIGKLAAGEVDIAFASDVSIFRAAAAGTPLQLQGEAYTAGRNTMALVTLPGSDYTEPTLKKSPKIAVNMLDDVGVLAARSVFGTAGIDVTRIQFKQHPFDRMPQALQAGEVDAAWMVEPYITRAEKELGASILADGARGATLDFPMSAYVSSGAFGQGNARTLAAFRKVLGEAQVRAADSAVVRDALPTFSDIDRTTASLISLGTYPVSLNGIRLQRVADLMHNSGMIGARLDVQALVPRP